MVNHGVISPDSGEISTGNPGRTRVLIITYYWPPSGGAGVQRFLKFVKYLPQYGVDPVVLTCANPTYPIQDPTLAGDIPDGVPVHHARTIEPFNLYGKVSGTTPEEAASPATVLGSWDNNLQRAARWLRANLFVPDARVGWIPFVRRTARDLIGRYHIETVVTTGPPHSTHFAGRWLKKKTGIRWVADFRDPWTDIHYNRVLPRTGFTRRRDLRMEMSILQQADEVTVTAPGTARYFAEKVERIYHTIPNGFDPDDFPAAISPGDGRISGTGSQSGSQSRDPDANRIHEGKKEPFLIRHVGSITETCLPYNLLAAVRNLSQMPIKVEFVGMVHPRLHDLIRELGLETRVSVRPYVPHRNATALMQQSDMNVVVVHRSDDSRILIPGKLYDYLYAGRPVMVIGPPEGDAAQIVRNCGMGHAFDYEDAAGPENWIRHLAGVHHTTTHSETATITYPPLEADENEIARYARPELTRRLTRILTSSPDS